MKRFRSVVALLLVLMLATIPFCGTAAAAKAKGAPKALKTGKWYKALSDDHHTVYVLDVPEDSIVKFQWKNNIGPQSYDVKCTFCTALDERGYPTGTTRILGARDESTQEYPVTGSNLYAFNAGRYYVVPHDPKENTQMKLTLTAAVNKPNYCKNNAVALKKNKTVTIGQTPNHAYTRWYKITLSGAQKLRLYTNEGITSGFNAPLDLYDAKLKKIYLDETVIFSHSSYSRKTYVSKEKLSKGAYYVRVVQLKPVFGSFMGDVFKLKWK